MISFKLHGKAATWILTIFLFAILPTLVFAQKADSIHAVVKGIVRIPNDTTGLFFPPIKEVKGCPRALPNTIVIILNADSSVVTGATVDEKGSYIITEVPAGKYILKAFYIGFEKAYKSITIAAGDTLSIDLILGEVYPPEELPFGPKEARKDFKSNQIELREMDSITLWYVPEKVIKEIKKCEKNVRRKFGFTLRNVQDEFEAKGWRWHKINQANIRYNEAMKKLLQKYNGPNWYEQYLKQERQCSQKIIKQVKDSVRNKNH